MKETKPLAKEDMDISHEKKKEKPLKENRISKKESSIKRFKNPIILAWKI